MEAPEIRMGSISVPPSSYWFGARYMAGYLRPPYPGGCDGLSRRQKRLSLGCNDATDAGSQDSRAIWRRARQANGMSGQL